MEQSLPGDSGSLAHKLDMYPCGYILVSATGIIQEVNQFICNITGYSKSELNNGKSIIDLFTRGSRIYYDTHLLPILQLQKFITEVYCSLLSKDGKIITVLVNAQILNNEQTGVNSIQFAVVLFSQRNKFEEEMVLANKKNKELIEKLQQQNELSDERNHLIRGLLKEAPMALFSFQMDAGGVMSIPYYNNVFAEIFAESMEQDGTVNALKIFSQLHPDDEKDFVNKIKESYHSVTKFTAIVRSFDKDQAIRFIKIVSQPTKKDSGLVLWKGSLEDVTEKILIDRQLKKIETFNKGVLNSLGANISVIDTTGNIVAVNESWDRFSINNGESSLIKTGNGANYFTVLEKAVEMGDNSAMEILRGIKHVVDGEASSYSREYSCHSLQQKRWFRMNVVKFEGNESKIVIAHENITESKLAEEKVQLAYEKFREISWMQSHKVRAPLAKIMSIIHHLNSSIHQVETKGNFKEMLDLLMLTANELDAVVRKISDKASHDENNLLDKLDATPENTDNSKFDQPNKKLQLLLVDDDPGILMINEIMVVENGLSENPLCFINGKLALNFLMNEIATNDFFLVYLDINMPVMDGWQFLDSLQHIPGNERVFVIMLSSSADGRDKQKAFTYPNVLDFFEKPLTDELAARTIKIDKLIPFLLPLPVFSPNTPPGEEISR